MVGQRLERKSGLRLPHLKLAFRYTGQETPERLKRWQPE